MQVQTYHSESEEQTVSIGQEIGKTMEFPSIILLEGCLGAGKTALTRGLVSGLGDLIDLESLVHSPTFSLINQYDTPAGRIYHVDLYRLDERNDQYSIGLEEIFGEDAVVIIEWSEKLKIKTDNPVLVRISVGHEDQRIIELTTRPVAPEEKMKGVSDENEGGG
jgi:tRNA threonylcarbamoyladenosine biosynthesis protein TsaE